MRNDFERGAYNPDEHNHSDEKAWPTDRLQRRSKQLSDSLNSIEHHPIRKAEIQREIGLLATELWFRNQGQ